MTEKHLCSYNTGDRNYKIQIRDMSGGGYVRGVLLIETDPDIDLLIAGEIDYLPISYCPFCGDHLDTLKEASVSPKKGK